MQLGVSRDRRWEASLLPGHIRIICLPGGTGHWRGRGAGMARAWRGLICIFWLGVARAWRGRGADMSCSPCSARRVQPSRANAEPNFGSTFARQVSF
eukprot:gene23878-biopygen17869